MSVVFDTSDNLSSSIRQPTFGTLKSVTHKGSCVFMAQGER